MMGGVRLIAVIGRWGSQMDRGCEARLKTEQNPSRTLLGFGFVTGLGQRRELRNAACVLSCDVVMFL